MASRLRFSSVLDARGALVCLLLGAVLLTGCGDGSPAGDSAGSKLRFVATTGQIHDALVHLTKGVPAEIKLLCGPGVDPHSYSASTKDIKAMQSAKAIFYNGFHLEAKLDSVLHDTFRDKAWSMASVFPADQRLEWVEDGKVDPHAPVDPHIWNNLPGWIESTKGLADQLAKLDPENAAKYQQNAKAYVSDLEKCHAWAKETLATIPPERRFLVSTHDAFNYFAKQYSLKAEAVLGIGNDPEASMKVMGSVAKMICDKKIPVIFMESITNPKVTTALKEACSASGWDVEIAKERLFSDDLGDKAPQDTFIGAFKSNVNVITQSLGAGSRN